MRKTAMSQAPIDLWDFETFDAELAASLRNSADLVRAYFETENRIFREYELGTGRSSLGPRPSNPYSAAFYALGEDFAGKMRSRTIRGFHYTRLTDSEVETMQRDGIHLSTLETLRARLDAAARDGLVEPTMANALYFASPFHEQLNIRGNRFWLTSRPFTVDDSAVIDLLANWGGEATYFWLQDPSLRSLVKRVGKPRVVEVAVPFGETAHYSFVGDLVLATFAHSIGCVAHHSGIDVCLQAALTPDAILAVHSEGDAKFAAMGLGYPPKFVDRSRQHWSEVEGGEG